MTDPRLIRTWLDVLHGDAAGHVQVCSTGDWVGRTFPTSQLETAAAYAAQLDQAGPAGVYARVTTVREPLPPGQRGGAADSHHLPALWADLDIAGPGHQHDPAKHHGRPLPPDTDTARKIIDASGLPGPTLWVHSGGGLYPIWLLHQPTDATGDQLPDLQALCAGWQRLIEHAAAQLGYHYGRGVGDLARVLRIPGTTNRKTPDQPAPCTIIEATPQRYGLAELEQTLAERLPHLTPARPQPAPNPPRPAGDGLSPGDDYNHRGTWAELLTAHGWREHNRRGEVTYWTRPGKPTGISATTNALGTNRLHVFTTSTELDADQSYSLFGAYAAIEHGGDHRAAAKALSRAGYGTLVNTQQRQLLTDLLGPPTAASASAPEVAADAPAERPTLDVTNPGETADWLRTQLGTGPLAGMFDRGGQVVHTPTIGDDGYHPLTTNAGDDDGPAQVRPVTHLALASRISYLYRCHRLVKRGDQWVAVGANFPADVARIPLDVPDMVPGLRRLRGVIHTPTLRPDGTLLDQPGYDPATGLLHLPEPGLTVPPVPARPTAGDLGRAVTLLTEMIAGFPFVTQHHRANYLGLLLTPLLRTLCPPPYKLGAIEAHQPASGKSLLAALLRAIHGGVVRSEMPTEDAELSKQLTAILMVTTGPVVTWDNVSGAIRSSVLAGLLTERTLSDRPLGRTDYLTFTNDRLWTLTGNNMVLGGDLSRRTISVMIDPGMPQPEKRTNFAIPDLPKWVREKRGELLHALLTLIRVWVLEGQPRIVGTSDGYATWVSSVRGILTTAGIVGEFDHNTTTRDGVGADDEQWRDFLLAIHRAMGDQAWTVRDLLPYIGGDGLTSTSPISWDDLPDELATKAQRNGIGSISRSLGWWLRNRQGRWAGPYCVRAVGDANVKTWQVFTLETQP